MKWPWVRRISWQEARENNTRLIERWNGLLQEHDTALRERYTYKMEMERFQQMVADEHNARIEAEQRYHDLVTKLVSPQLNPVAKIVKSDANAEEQLMAQEREAFSPETYETMKRGLIVDYGLNPEAAEEAAQALWQQMHESLTGDDRSLLNSR